MNFWNWLLSLFGVDFGYIAPTPNSTGWIIGPVINGVNSSHNMPLSPNPEGTGWGFDFPSSDGVHYVTKAQTGALHGTISAKFTISGTGTLVPSPGGGTSAPKARLYIQRAGDDWSTVGYRWWSAPSTLEVGQHTLSIPLTFSNWTSIYGTTGVTEADFNATLQNPANVGITFGADFAGHGLYSNGPVHFSMNSYTIG